MVILWLRFALRQLATALVVVTSILLLSEILLPASILPYFNLHILVLVTIVIALMSAGGPPAPLKGGLRVVILVPIATLLLAYAWLMFGASMSGLALFAAFAILLVGVTVALVAISPSDGNTSPSVPLLRKEREEDQIEVEIVEEELDIFMR